MPGVAAVTRHGRRQGWLAFATLSALVAISACTDGATRIAYDIESGAAAFHRPSATSYTIRHRPEATPGGCAGPYSVQLITALVIWCKRSTAPITNDDPGRATSRHITSYHNRFIDASQTFTIEKAAGEPLLIDPEKRGGKIVAVGLR